MGERDSVRERKSEERRVRENDAGGGGRGGERRECYFAHAWLLLIAAHTLPKKSNVT